MSKGILHSVLTSQSVVDDVDTASVDPLQIGSDAKDDPEVIHLGEGYIEINGHLFHEDWDEIDPPDSEDEPEIPHEKVMAYLQDLMRNRRERRAKP